MYRQRRNLVEAWNIMFAFRGIGYKFGKNIKLPSHPELSKPGSIFLILLQKITVNFLIVDILVFFWSFTAPNREPWGGSIFIQSLPWPQRYLMSTIYHATVGCLAVTLLNTGYYIYTLIGVYILSQPYESWPPLFDNPFASQSLHDLWAKRWHALLTRSLFVLGGWPGQRIVRFLGIRGDIGLVLGSLLASGLFHEFPLYSLGNDLDWRIVAFFGIQGIGLILERLWNKATGTYVGGWYGVLWVYLFLFVLGQPLFTDSYASRGLCNGVVIPSTLSPTNRILLPLLNHLPQMA
ncbi:hypothetical protein BU17DRAFT_55313 [Hysterangium stoloniferum]|nr:hypothetical protein BU17DRAFT_55313 [Hysterangium stoloniferum]